MTRRGFSLAELLVSVAILGTLAALMFPIFRSAIDSAKRTECGAHFRQIGYALTLYLGDYDDRVPPVNYQPVRMDNPIADRTWVQTLLPYTGSLSLFICPSDIGRTGSESQMNIMKDGTIADPWILYYDQSLRSNLGYNYLYLSPLVYLNSGVWEAFPIRMNEIVNKSLTVVFIDSLWDRTNNGVPYGGGSWAVEPPCRYALFGGEIKDTFNFPNGTIMYFGFKPEGWAPEDSKMWQIYGGAWPWHRGKFNVMYADIRVKNVTVGALTQGCDFKPYWEGLIKDSELYPWDITE